MGMFSLLGSLVGSSKAKKASKKAEKARLAFEQKALDQQQAQFAVTQANEHPFIEAGTRSIGQQGDLLGLNGQPAWQASLDALRESPYYKSLYRSGEEAVLQNASATGGLRGGNTQRSLADFGEDTFTKALMQRLSDLGGLSTLGANTAAGLGTLSQQNSNAQSSIFDQMGATRAGGILTRGGITAGMWNNAGQFLDQAVQAALAAGAGPGGAGFNFGSFVKGM